MWKWGSKERAYDSWICRGTLGKYAILMYWSNCLQFEQPVLQQSLLAFFNTGSRHSFMTRNRLRSPIWTMWRMKWAPLPWVHESVWLDILLADDSTEGDRVRQWTTNAKCSSGKRGLQKDVEGTQEKTKRVWTVMKIGNITESFELPKLANLKAFLPWDKREPVSSRKWKLNMKNNPLVETISMALQMPEKDLFQSFCGVGTMGLKVEVRPDGDFPV